MELNGRLWKVGLIFRSRSVHISVLFRIKAGLISCNSQRYTYRVLQTIQVKLILLCVWADLAVLGSTKTALKFK